MKKHSLLTLILITSALACQRDRPQPRNETATIELTPLTLGSPEDERCRDPDEKQRTVALSGKLKVMRTEVTQTHFKTLMGYNPSGYKRCPSCPVESVSWHEAQAFCLKLSQAQKIPTALTCTGTQAQTRCTIPPIEDPGFRLPTEQEWELAARANSTEAAFGGPLSACMTRAPSLEPSAWIKTNSTGHPHPVAQKKPNPYGLHDMAGNVYEWTSSPYDDQDQAADDLNRERVLRGGSWYHNAEHARFANRERAWATKRLGFVGFRCIQRVL